MNEILFRVVIKKKRMKYYSWSSHLSQVVAPVVTKINMSSGSEIFSHVGYGQVHALDRIDGRQDKKHCHYTQEGVVTKILFTFSSIHHKESGKESLICHRGKPCSILLEYQKMKYKIH